MSTGARSRRERLDIETTLRNLHRTPLNDQPSAAPSHLGFPAGLINRTAADTGGITPGRNALAGATPGFGALGIMAGMIGRSPYDAGGIAPPARNALSSGAISGIAADLGGYSPFGFGGLAAAASHGMRPASASPCHNPLMPAVEPEPSKGLMSRYLTAPPSRQS